MRPRAERTKHDFIFARVFSGDKERIAEAARQRGLSLSDFIRATVIAATSQAARAGSTN